MNLYRQAFFITSFLFLSFSTQAQMTSCGRNFFISLLEFGFPSYTIVSEHAASVNFHYFADPDSDTTFTLEPGEITYIPAKYSLAEILATNNIANHEVGVIDNHSMMICSDSNITVLFENEFTSAEDATVVYPVIQPNLDSFNYLTIGAGNDGSPGPSRRSAIIISHYDNVILEITPKYDVGEYGGEAAALVNLNMGETIVLSSPSQDLTGSSIKIISGPPNPITVFSSYSTQNLEFPWDFGATCCADYLLEQILPQDTWDTMYHFIPCLIADGLEAITGSPSLSAVARILSPYDDNEIRINGSYVASLSAGGCFDTLLSASSVITSTRPSIVNQFLRSVFFTEVDYGDPDQMWIHPLKNGIKHSIFSTLSNFPPAYVGLDWITTLTLIADTSVDEVLLDGVNILDDFSTFSSAPTYKYLQVSVNDEQHELKSDKKIVAYINTLTTGQGGASYALPGLNDAPIIGEASSQHTLYMCDSSAILSGRDWAHDHLWSTGETTKSILVSEDGMYTVTSSYACNTTIDTFYIRNIVQGPLQIADTFICKDDSMSLNAYQDYLESYLWNTGETTSVITITEPGVYIVTASTEHCPEISDSIIVHSVAEARINLPADTILCEGQPVAIGYEMDGISYQWNTGSTECCIVPAEAGTYILQVRNKCQETNIDSFQLVYTGCDNCLLVPNAFSPNGDGLNDEFSVVSDCMMGGYRLDIFNRYGQRIFISYNPTDGWDGTFNGAPVDVGVYFYYVQAHHVLKEGEVLYKKGDVTLIR